MTDAWSITDGYWDVDGEWHPTPAETQDALRSAMGGDDARPPSRAAPHVVRAPPASSTASGTPATCPRGRRRSALRVRSPARPPARLPRAPTARRRPQPPGWSSRPAAARCPSGPGAGRCSCTPCARSGAGASATSPTCGTSPAGRRAWAPAVAMISPLHARAAVAAPRPEPVLRAPAASTGTRCTSGSRTCPAPKPSPSSPRRWPSRSGAERTGHHRPGRGVPAEADRPEPAVRAASWPARVDARRLRHVARARGRAAAAASRPTARWPSSPRHRLPALAGRVPAPRHPRRCAGSPTRATSRGSASTSGASGSSTASWPPPVPPGSA